jgi:hypothetical protein
MEWVKHGDGTPAKPDVWVSGNGWYAIEKYPNREYFKLRAKGALGGVHKLGEGTSLPAMQAIAVVFNDAVKVLRDGARCPFGDWWRR